MGFGDCLLDDGTYIFVINTNKYAGNFERELCAYCTGIIGECEVGQEEAKIFLIETDCAKEDNPFEDKVAQVPDDHGCTRPCSIFDCNGKYNSVAIYFYDEPPLLLIDRMKLRATNYSKKTKKFDILGFSMFKYNKKEAIIPIELK